MFNLSARPPYRLAPRSTTRSLPPRPLAALQITAPLITRKIIEQLTLAHTYHVAEKSDLPTTGLATPKSVGYGVGLAIALFAMEMTASLFTYQSTQRGSVVGFLMRASVSAVPISS